MKIELKKKNLIFHGSRNYYLSTYQLLARIKDSKMQKRDNLLRSATVGRCIEGHYLPLQQKILIYLKILGVMNFSGFSKGWKEAFMSGEQEPWVFRGGLTADLQVLFYSSSPTFLL